MGIRIRSVQDLLAGLIFMALGGVFASSALGLTMGTASKMGPGYFPTILSFLLIALGVAIVGRGLVVSSRPTINIEWRGLIVITLAAIAFGLAFAPLGFVPALALAVAISTLASPRFTPLSAALLVAGLTGFSWIVFIVGLKLPWLAFNPSLLGY